MSITSLKRTEHRCTQAVWTIVGIAALLVIADIIAIPLLTDYPELQTTAEAQAVPIVLLGPAWGILVARRKIYKAIKELQRPVV